MILLPGMLLAMFAQARVQSAYRKYLQIGSAYGHNGAHAAQTLLHAHGIYDVEVVQGAGELTDQYDPRRRQIVLSPNVYHSSSIAALAIAAHETGHAIQHSEGYIPLSFRSSLAPVAQISSTAALPLFFIGMLLGSYTFAMLGIYLFTGVIIFQMVTLPVEFNASRIALIALDSYGIVTRDEYSGARKVLSAAALTYVASLAVSLLQLLRLLALSGSNRRRR